MDTIRVTAPRPRHDASAASRTGTATVIPLGREGPSGRDLGDLLDRTAGVHVHRYGGLGSFSLASVRGSAPGQVLICLDGSPVGSAGDGFVNLALLPVASLDKAEVYRGPQTHSFGGPPAAGVINLVTPSALIVPLRLSLGAGSFGTAAARGQWGAGRGSISGMLSGQVRQSRGDFPYLDRNGTLLENTADDHMVRRANNDFTDAAFLGKCSFVRNLPSPGRAEKSSRWFRGKSGRPVPRCVRLDYTGQVFHRASGIPGTESVQTHDVRFADRRIRQDLGGRADFFPAGVLRSVETGLHYEMLVEGYENRAGEVGLTPAASEHRGIDQGLHLGLVCALPLSQEMRGYWDLREEHMTPTDLLSHETGPRLSRRHRTLSLEDRLAWGRLELEGAYRWVRMRDNFSGTDEAEIRRSDGATFGLRWEAMPGLVLRGNRGRLARFPTFPELFGENGIEEGNPGLQPEQGVQWDAGLSFSPKIALRAECVYFESLLRDRIVWLQNSQRTTRAQNLDRTWTRGIESSLYGRLDLPLAASLELTGNLTWLEARDVGLSPAYQGKRLPNLPAWEEYLSALLARGGNRLRWETSLRSSHFRDRYNTPAKRAPGNAVHDVSMERLLLRGKWKLHLEVRNVGNDRVQDIDGFPLPGRSGMVEVTWTR